MWCMCIDLWPRYCFCKLCVNDVNQLDWSFDGQKNCKWDVIKLLYPPLLQVSDNHNGTHILKPKLLAELKVCKHDPGGVLGMRLVWAESWEWDWCEQSPGNETGVGRVLGMRLVWVESWEWDWCGQSPGNETGVGGVLGMRLVWVESWEWDQCDLVHRWMTIKH